MAELAPQPKLQFFDSNGDPLVGGKVYTYEAGTNTPKATYQDYEENTLNTNPVTLDARGEAEIRLVSGSYKFIIRDSAEGLINTIDNVQSQSASFKTSATFLDGAYIELREQAVNGVNYNRIKSPASLAGNTTYTLPSADGASGQVMRTDGAGVMSWVNNGLVATTNKTTTYLATTADNIINCDATSAGFTVTLYPASGNTGKWLIIRKTDSSLNAVTIDGNLSETIDSSATTTLNTIGESIHLVCDGTNWYSVSRKIPQVMTSFTPTGSWSTNTTYTGLWRRNGKFADFQVKVALSGAPTSASLYIDLPSGFVIDTSVLLVGGATSSELPSNGAIVDGGTTFFAAVGYYYNGETSRVYVFTRTASGTYVGGLAVTQAIPMTFANTDTVQLFFSIPVVGWND
jgi:hypothetical protein